MGRVAEFRSVTGQATATLDIQLTSLAHVCKRFYLNIKDPDNGLAFI